MTVDLLYIAIGIAFFALTVALTYGCERLRKPR